jgi:hypothetical protein
MSFVGFSDDLATFEFWSALEALHARNWSIDRESCRESQRREPLGMGFRITNSVFERCEKAGANEKGRQKACVRQGPKSGNRPALAAVVVSTGTARMRGDAVE